MRDSIKIKNRLYKASRAVLLAALVTSQMTSLASAETLEQAWAAALAADHGLKASRQNTAAADRQLAAAKAARLPSAGMSADYIAVTELPSLKADLLGQSFQIPLLQRNGAVYNATATLPIYTGGRIEHGIAAASSSLQATKLDETTYEHNLKLRVAEAYVNVLRSYRGRQVAESHQIALEAHAHDIENLAQQGMAAKNAQLSAQVALLDARQQVLQATGTLDLACAAYNRLLGRALDQPVNLDEISTKTTDEEVPVLIQRALAQRSELKSLDRQIAAVHNQAVAVRRETFPLVGLSGGYNYLQDRYLAHDGQWIVALGIKWNAFDGGSSRSRKRDRVSSCGVVRAAERTRFGHWVTGVPELDRYSDNE